MKSKLDLDPDFAVVSSRRHALAWLLGLFSIFAIVTSLTLLSSTVARTAPQPLLAQQADAGPAAARLKTHQRVPSASAIKLQPRDHFVVVASPTIDPEMVHRAPAEIDEGMVVPPRDAEPALPSALGPAGAKPPGYFEVPGVPMRPQGQIAPLVPVDPPASARPR